LGLLKLDRDLKDLTVSLTKSLDNGKLTIKNLLDILSKEKLSGNDQVKIIVNVLQSLKKKIEG